MPYIKPWSKVFWADDACWVTGENNAGASILQRLDPVSLDVLSVHTFDANYRVLSLLHAPGDSVLWLSGEGNFERNQTVFLKAVPKDDPAIVPTRSVSVTNIRLEQVPVYSIQPFCQLTMGLPIKIAFGPVHVTVKNTGTTPVSRFRVNGRFNTCWFICNAEDQYSVQYDIPLAPGDSVEILMFGNLILEGQPNSTAFDLCFWTALPDDRLDSIPEDDRYCETFSVIVSDEEPETVAHAVRVSPNPAQDQAIFSVETPDADGARYRITLTNSTGQVMLQTVFTGTTWTLESGAIPAGMYFYQIAGPNDLIGSGRLVISR
ncbi:MAG: T9SS type A sorting domain-containing protein [Lewinellaceae bacterium]|nr:T9SS type A sorting domain-containing protein [Lewinellaceae bacterium]